MAASTGRKPSSGRSSQGRRTTSQAARRESSSGTKRSTSSRSSSNSRKQAQGDDNIVIGIIIAVIATAVFVIFPFLCCANIINNGLGQLVKSIMMGLMGYGAFFVPLAIILFVVFLKLVPFDKSYRQLFVLAAIVISALIALLISHLSVYPDIEDIDMGFFELNDYFYKAASGGGAIFGILTFGICKLITKIGCIFLIIVLCVVDFVLIVPFSVMRMMKETAADTTKATVEVSKKAYNKSKEAISDLAADIRKESPNFDLSNPGKKVQEPVKETVVKPEPVKKDEGFDVQIPTFGNKAPEKKKDEGFVIDISGNTPVQKVIKSKDIHEEFVTEDVQNSAEEEEEWLKPVGIKETKKEQSASESGFSFKKKEVHPPEPVPVIEEEPEEEEEEYIDIEVKEEKVEKAAFKEQTAKPIPRTRKYKLPTVDLLNNTGKSKGADDKSLDETAAKLSETLKTFGVDATIIGRSKGPAVTRFELQPAMGVKVSKIVSLADDIKLNLAAEDIRIEAPIPGKNAVGIEVPNKESSAVSFYSMIASPEFKAMEAPLTFAVGEDIAGQKVVTDIAKMPHLLIAGATGSGKSVCINTLIMSILFKSSPDDVRLIMVDPKVVELSVYNGIPHLLCPVVTDPKEASNALKYGVREMTDRYKKFADMGVRDLKGYNQAVENGQTGPDGEELQKMPHIVIIVDELADLMMTCSKEVEESICRLAQLARAAGIHLIIATQRPSVDVITGLIKANMPSRIAFSVSSAIDSRTILDQVGAEKLLGKGDMLYSPQSLNKPLRVQGAFVSDKEVADVCGFIRAQGYTPNTLDSSKSGDGQTATVKMNSITNPEPEVSGEDDDKDEYFKAAAKLVIEKEKGSIGMLQRYFKVGFNRAARIMDQLEEAGVVGPEEDKKPRRILMTLEEFEQL